VTQSNTPYPFHHDAKPTVEKRDLQAGIYIVATPLGNLKDITVRALEILHSVDLILCEDTRVSRTLLMHYSVSAPLKALHDYNESKMIPSLLVQVQEGKRLALISDAGTPLISDPGYKLVRAALTAGLFITGFPVPSTVINALVL
jgi:16S rRNA (cytidine1402-2'-O)-methyltransferase